MKITPNLTVKRTVLAQNIRDKYSILMKAIVDPYSQNERETWATQLTEANDWLADNTATVPMISAMATARGITVETLVTKIKENEQTYRTSIGQLLGQQQKELDTLYKGE